MGMSDISGSGQAASSVIEALAHTVGDWRGLSTHLEEMEKAVLPAEQEATAAGRLADGRVLYIIVPDRGQVHFVINEEQTPLRLASAVVCEPGDMVAWHMPGGGAATVWRFRFALTWEGGPDADNGQEGSGRSRMFLPAADFRIRSLYHAIEQGWRQHALEQFRCQSLFAELLYILIRQQHEASREDSQAAIAATKRYMERRYMDKLTIEQLAHRTDMSQGYFLQQFKKIYGTSPIEYITECRIAAARDILRQSPAMPLGDVAKSVGYDDEGYFSRRFRQKLGISPVAYKKNSELKVIALNYHTIGHLLALQIIPSGAILDPRYVWDYYEQYNADVDLHLHSMPDEETVIRELARHRPDLIVLRDNTNPIYVAQLRQAASVLLLPWNADVQWRELFVLSASFLNKEAQAERWLGQYERKVDAVKRKLPAAVRRDTLLVVSASDYGLFIVGDRHAGSVLYQDLDLTPACPTAEAMQPTTPETLGTIPADRVLIISDSGPAAERQLAELANCPTWQQSGAVRNRKVHRVQRGLWFEYTPHAHLWSLDAAARLFR